RGHGGGPGARLADQHAWPVSRRPAGDPGDAPQRAGRHDRGRGHGLAPQRALAESMARHLGPSGIHVALIVVDGVVGGPITRSRFADRPNDAFIDPAGVAAIAASLVKQDRSAWSFE